MSAATGQARLAGSVFRLSAARVVLATTGVGAGVGAVTLLVLTILAGGVGASLEELVFWVAIAGWMLTLGAATGCAVGVVALVLRELARGDVPLAALRWVLGVVAAATTVLVLRWALSAESVPLLALLVVVGGALGWLVPRLTLATGTQR